MADTETKSTIYQWQLLVYAILFVSITPVYILILISILNLRRHIVLFKSTFYTILIQHSIADILSLFFYSFQKVTYILIPYLLYNNQKFRIAAVYYGGMSWSIIIRSNGIVLMTIHRYFIIAKPTHKITKYVQLSKSWKIWIIYWLPSIAFSALCFSDSEIGFDSPERMLLVMDSSIISKNTRTTFLYLLVSCIICIITYACISKFIRARSHSVSKSLRREIRLAFQVSLSSAAQIFLLVYLLFLNVFAEMDNTEQITYTRKFYLLVYGTLSFIGPFTILIFNKDVSNRIWFMIFRRKMKWQMESSVASIMKLRKFVATTRV